MIRVGIRFRGFCSGYFGQNYGEKVVEGFSTDWIVVRENGDFLLLAQFNSENERDALVKGWEAAEK